MRSDCVETSRPLQLKPTTVDIGVPRMLAAEVGSAPAR